MQQTIARGEVFESRLSFDFFVDELAAALAMLMPEVRVTALEGGVRLRRGSATAEVISNRPLVATVVLKQDCERVLGAGVAITAQGLNDLAADLVGFFCGASLVTLSIYPHVDPPRQTRTRPRRRGPYDAPLIPLPLDPPVKLRI